MDANLFNHEFVNLKIVEIAGLASRRMNHRQS